MLENILGRVPSLRFGSGYALQVLTGYACCGLSAPIPHAKNKVKNVVLPCNMFFFKEIKHALRGRGLRPRPRKNSLF